ncbi:Smr/MutS family protein [Desulfovibrio psychrotolerans]|uniref:DNA mismatch repair protein MutS n=1 Tax=Desulfovibrio psychrotolerans TaxID=415242 RepID=A0A7J0BTZ3_9BACT|nr:Smr/MutS family protein [Desulfovibrio psychrotolerans]GFM36605.1 DNA mismatch repair protein MutS [Desulfovibrio psychrotolerans]
MSSDENNPFKKLDKSLFRKEGQTDPAEMPAVKPCSAAPGKGKGRNMAAPDLDGPEEGAADFLRAMAGVAPVGGRGRQDPPGGKSVPRAAAGAPGQASHGAHGGRERSAAKDEEDTLLFMAELDAFKAAAKRGKVDDTEAKPETAMRAAPVGRENAAGTARAVSGVFSSAARSGGADRGGMDGEAFHDVEGAGDEDAEAFLRAMQGVEGITAGGRDVQKKPERPARVQQAARSADALQDVLDGGAEFHLEYSEEFIQGHVSGFDPMVLGRLRAGQFSPEAHLDMHGMVAQEAYEALTGFMRGAYVKGLRTVLLIPGRGKNSPEGFGVLRENLQHWLTRDPFKRVVLAFCTAQPRDGGAGAVYVMLRKFKKSRGKIQWDRMPPDPDLYL